MAHATPRTAAVPALVKQLYELVGQLEELFPDRSFALDGHLVGSIGEVLAADRYQLKLLSMAEKVHDAQTPNGLFVQIKTTQCESVGLRSEPAHLIVLKLADDGTTTEIYNGPGAAPWAEAGPRQKNGQCSIGLAKLRGLMANVPPEQQLPVTQPA